MVSQGRRWLVYSFCVDSVRKAYFPFFLRTVSTPSSVDLTKTQGSLDDMKAHIRSKVGIVDFWKGLKDGGGELVGGWEGGNGELVEG